jgi:GNAT superfamily N-acetyltransferase
MSDSVFAPTAPGAVSVRFVEAGDEEAWKRLYAAYRDFYRLEAEPAVVDRVWRWILGREHGLRGLVATTTGSDVIGLANVRTFARPSSGSIGLYLDDLFTSPEHRGIGAANAQLTALADLARTEGATVVRWITDDQNATARSVYDSRAKATRWVTYDLAPASV